MKDTAKATVAWDTWRTNPARATGATTINVVTCFLPGGEATTALKAARGIRGATDTGLLGRFLGHTDDTPVPRLPDIVPDAAATAARAGDQLPPTVGDLARSIGHDARPHLPDLDDPLASTVREQDTRTAKECNESSARNGPPDEIREPDKDSAGSSRREDPVDGPENREGPDSDSAALHERAPEHRGGRSHVHETEWPIVASANEIYRSPAMDELRAAYAANRPTVVEFAGRTVQYEPDLPASGMTFGDAFLLGPRAFSSEGELAKTVLHGYGAIIRHCADPHNTPWVNASTDRFYSLDDTFAQLAEAVGTSFETSGRRAHLTTCRSHSSAARLDVGLVLRGQARLRDQSCASGGS
ncbi:MAG: hypothetical protein GEV10_17280 [Streptosporangiales bacterium]|nr:hypothetical protein [Streptosporangiales bacterium]